MTTTAPDAEGKKLGPLWFRPGLSYLNISTQLYGAFSTLGVITFLSFVQPYLLTEVLQIPKEEQGSLTGNLIVLSEVIVILLMGFVGATADRMGQRKVYVFGFGVVALGYLIYPFASSVWQIYLFRTIFAVGTAIIPVMLSVGVVEYIQERSRGRWVGVSSIFNGLGVIFMSLVLAKTPSWYLEYGANPVEAGRYAFWTAASLAVVSGAILWFGLNENVGKSDRPREESIFGTAKEGLFEAKRNKFLALAFAAAFIGRGDLVIVGNFFSLWVTHIGEETGVDPAEAVAWAGLLFGAVIQFSAMLWAFFIGMIADKFDRVLALALGLGIATLGYYGIGSVDDPFGMGIIPFCIILGMGETSVIITAGALLGQEMPKGRRSAVVGAYSLLGGVGILVAGYAGGKVFDNIAPTAPFTMMAIVNFILMIIAIVMWKSNAGRSFYVRKAQPDATTPEASKEGASSTLQAETTDEMQAELTSTETKETKEI